MGRAASPAALADRLAAEARCWYAHERSAYESMRANRAVKWTPPRSYDGTAPALEGRKKAADCVWLRLGEWFARERISPMEFLRFAFEETGLGEAPEPRQLMTPKWLGAWRAAEKELPREIAAEFARDRQVARSRTVAACRFGGLDGTAAALETATDPGAQLTPLFRCCLAWSLRKKDGRWRAAAERYREPALRQLRRAPAVYAQVFGAWLPPRLLAAARAE